MSEIVHKLKESKFDENLVKSLTVAQVFAHDNQAIMSLDQIAKAMDTVTDGEGKEWIPVGTSPRLIERIRRKLKVTSLFDTIPMPTDPYDNPLEGGDAVAYLVPENLGDTDQEAITPSTPGTAKIRFSAATIGAMTRISKKVNADSIIPLVPHINQKLLLALATGRERAILNGDLSGTHMDSGVSNAKDVRKAWKGLRKHALVNNHVVDCGGDFTVQHLFAMMALAGIYAENPEDCTWIFSPMAYARARAFPEMLTWDKIDRNATIVTGQVGEFAGAPVVVSGEIPNNLAANGVISATPANNNFTGALLVYRGGFVNGDRQEVDLDQDDTPKENLQRKLLADARWDFQSNYQGSEPTVVYGVNIPNTFPTE